MESSFFKLNGKDWVNGIVVAILGSILGVLQNAISSGTLNIFTYNWLGIGKLAAGAAIAYLLKKLLTTADGKILGKI